MKKNFLLVILGILFFAFSTRTVAEENCKVTVADYSKICITLTYGDDIRVTDVETEKGKHSIITSPSFFPSSDVGNPNLPVLSRVLEIPLCEGVDYKIKSTKVETYTGKSLGVNYPIYPVQPSRSKQEEGPFEMVKNDETYAKNHFYANELVYVEKVGVARNVNMANLYFSPISYNPVTNEFKVVKEVELEITFKNADVQKTLEMKRKHSSQAFSVKADVMNSFTTKDSYTNTPIRYLIVSHSMFRGHLDSFVEWKKRKGFLVDVVYTDDANVGTTTASIQAFLKQQYTNATAEMPAPTYVLLVGDVEQIPPFESQITSASLNDHITDLYYFTWTDGDIIPDCYYGRFSAQSVAHLNAQVEKTLMYEQYTMADPSYLDKALLVAGEDDGRAGDFGYTHADPVIHYLENLYVNEEYGYTEVTSYYNPASGTYAAEQGVFNALNNGVGFANYSAHCNYDRWSIPEFSNSDVNRMNNAQKFGLMIGNCCLSNKFNVTTCLGEALLRKADYKGAVGYIGGSNSTYWSQDYYWAVGVRNIGSSGAVPSYDQIRLGAYDCLFHTHNESYADWYTSNGAIIMAGNMSVNASTSSNNYKKYYWEIYHLMGDPSVMTWLTQAEELSLQVQNTLFNDATSLRVQTEPYAYVAFKDEEQNLIAAAFADEMGVANLTFQAVNTLGTFELAVSAQNFQTAFVPISVIAPEGPFVVIADVEPMADYCQVGTDVIINAKVANRGVEAAQNVWLEFKAVDDTKMKVWDTVASLSDLAVEQEDSVRTRIHILSNAKHGERLSLEVKAHWADSGYSSYTYKFDAKGYQIRKQSEVMTNLTDANRKYFLAGDSLKLTVKYKNTGGFMFRNVANTMYSLVPWMTVTNGRDRINIVVGGEIEVEYVVELAEGLQEGVAIPLVNVISNGHYTYIDTINVTIGRLVEDFETGNLASYPWDTTTSQNPWQITSTEKYQGSYSMRSKEWASGEGHSLSSQISIVWTSLVDDSISFYAKVSSESNYDKLVFYIDGTDRGSTSGEQSWTRVAYFVPAGTHTFTFSYEKDGSVSRGSDCAWIDNVTLPFSPSSAYVYVTDTVCLGSTYSYGSVTVNTEGMEAGRYFYVDSTTSQESMAVICLTVAATPELEVNGATSILSGESTTLTASGAMNYMWLDLGETRPVITVSPIATTEYTVVGRSATCQPDTLMVKVVVDGVSITEADDNDNRITIYPNPAISRVVVDSKEIITTITMMDMNGRVVDVVEVNDYSYMWNVQKYERGAYILSLLLEDGSVDNRKLLIAK